MPDSSDNDNFLDLNNTEHSATPAPSPPDQDLSGTESFVDGDERFHKEPENPPVDLHRGEMDFDDGSDDSNDDDDSDSMSARWHWGIVAFLAAAILVIVDILYHVPHPDTNPRFTAFLIGLALVVLGLFTWRWFSPRRPDSPGCCIAGMIFRAFSGLIVIGILILLLYLLSIMNIRIGY